MPDQDPEPKAEPRTSAWAQEQGAWARPAPEAVGHQPVFAQPPAPTQPAAPTHPPAHPGYAQPQLPPGYARPSAQPGYGQPEYAPPQPPAHPGYAQQPGQPHPGYAPQQPSPGYPQPGYAQPGYAAAAPPATDTGLGYSTGQYPPGQYPPAQYPPAQYPPAQYPPAQWSEGQQATLLGETSPDDLPTETLPALGNTRRPAASGTQRLNRRTAVMTALLAIGTIAVGSGTGIGLSKLIANDKMSPDTSAVATVPPKVNPTTAGVTPTPTATPTETPTEATPTASESASEPASPTKAPTSTKKPSTGTKVPTGDMNKLELGVLTIVNQERAKQGCKALKGNSKLVQAARKHSQYMADTGKFGHDGIGDGGPQDRIDATGYKWRGWGENIAGGFSTPAAVMKAWMNSPGHRANILNCSFQEIGVGVDKKGTIWTQVFGTPA